MSPLCLDFYRACYRAEAAPGDLPRRRLLLMYQQLLLYIRLLHIALPKRRAVFGFCSARPTFLVGARLPVCRFLLPRASEQRGNPLRVAGGR